MKLRILVPIFIFFGHLYVDQFLFENVRHKPSQILIKMEQIAS